MDIDRNIACSNLLWSIKGKSDKEEKAIESKEYIKTMLLFGACHRPQTNVRKFRSRSVGFPFVDKSTGICLCLLNLWHQSKHHQQTDRTGREVCGVHGLYLIHI